MSLLREFHGVSAPLGTESSRLNTHDIDIPLGLELLAHGLREALHGPLCSAVEGE